MPERDTHLYRIRIGLESPLVPLPRMVLILLPKVDMPDGEKRADHRWIEFGRMLQQLNGLSDPACAKSTPARTR